MPNHLTCHARCLARGQARTRELNRLRRAEPDTPHIRAATIVCDVCGRIITQGTLDGPLVHTGPCRHCKSLTPNS